MVVVVAIIIRDDVVASEVDCVGTGDFEEDSLILSDGDVEGLLVVLLNC